MTRPSLGRRSILKAGALACFGGVAACQLPGQAPAPREFRVTPKTTFDELSRVTWALAVDRPAIDRAIDTNRIARTNGLEVEFYAGATWVDRPPAMLQPLIIQSFRNSGAIETVVDRRSELRPPFLLQTDILAFQAEPADAGGTQARVVLVPKLLTMPRREVIGTTEIGRSVLATGSDLSAIVAAFDDALGKVLKRVVEWTLLTGEGARVTS